MSRPLEVEPHEATLLHTTIVLHRSPIGLPDGGELAPFRPDSFREWLGHTIQVPGLDPVHDHVLRGVTVDPDGTRARLHLTTTLGVPGDITEHFNPAVSTPEAHIRIVDADTGDTLHRGTHAVPLLEGDTHRVAGQLVRVVDTSWPDRHPEHGAVQADEHGNYPHDVQEVRVRSVDAPQADSAGPAPAESVSIALAAPEPVPTPPGVTGSLLTAAPPITATPSADGTAS